MNHDGDLKNYRASRGGIAEEFIAWLTLGGLLVLLVLAMPAIVDWLGRVAECRS